MIAAVKLLVAALLLSSCVAPSQQTANPAPIARARTLPPADDFNLIRQKVPAQNVTPEISPAERAERETSAPSVVIEESPHPAGYVACDALRRIAEAQSYIDREKEIGRASGAVDLGELNDWGRRLVDAKAELAEALKALDADGRRLASCD